MRHCFESNADIRYFSMISRPPHFKAILLFLLVFYLLLLVGGYIWTGDTYLFDARTMVLSFLLGVIFIVAITQSKDSIFPHIAMATALFLIYVFPRILTYIFVSEIVVFPFGEGMTVQRINAAMIYVLSGTAMLLLGMFTSNVVLPAHGIKLYRERKEVFVSLRNMVAIFVLILAFEFFTTSYLGISAYGKMRADNYNTLLQFMKAFLAVDTFVFVALCVFIFEKKYQMMNWRIFIILMLVIYGVFSAWSGSRGFPIRVTSIIFGILLIAGAVLDVRAKHFFGVLILILVTGFLSYKVATIKRIDLVQDYSYEVLPARTNDAENPYDKAKQAVSSTTAKGVLIQILNRIAILDYMLQLPEQTGDSIALKKYMSLHYAVLSTANTLPGTPFPEARLSTSRAPSIVYRGLSEEYVVANGYFSEYWTMWVLVILICGWWPGLGVLFAIGFLLHAGFNMALRTRSGYGEYIQCFLLVFALPLVYFSMGIDHTLVSFIVIGLQVAAIFLLLKLFSSKKQ